MNKCVVNRQIRQTLSNSFYYEFYHEEKNKLFRFGGQRQFDNIVNKRAPIQFYRLFR